MHRQDGETPSAVGRTLRRATLLAAASAMALVTTFDFGVPISAQAESRLGGDIFARLQPVSDQVLAEERGKFMAEGFDINFGATIKTFVNGQLASVSTLTDPPKGTVTFNQVITPVQNLTVTQVNTKTGSGDPPGVTTGVVVNGLGGKSLVSTTFTPAGIQNLVVNDAAGRNIQQQVQLNLVINNFASVMRQAHITLTSANVLSGVRGLGALGHH